MKILNLIVFFFFNNYSFGEDIYTGESRNYTECGKNIKTDLSTKYIFKNLNARNRPGTWPWLISMGQQSGINGWEHRCGGSLVTPEHVITAAHCPLALFDEIKRGEIYVRAGDSHLKNETDDDGVQVVRVISFAVHPDYKFRYSDIGVLTLEHPVELTAVSRTICLPSNPTPRQSEDDRPLTVTGWGYTTGGYGSAGGALYDAHVQVYPEEYCNLTHLNAFNNRNTVPLGFTSDLFCGGDAAGSEGTCDGDSGSPAVMFQSLKQRYLLKGVVSGGLSCGTQLHPNIYVRVTDAKILSWIKRQILKKQPTTPPTTISNTGYTNCVEHETCTVREDCPSINSEYERYKAMRRDEPEKPSLRKKLKALICNSKQKKFCCPGRTDRQTPDLDSDGRNNDLDVNKTRDKQAMPDAMADFTQAFYNHMVNKSEGKNFAFSPMVLHAALTALYLGATPNSQTETELRDSLYGLNTPDTLKTEYKRIVDFYEQEESFRYGNKIWSKKGFEVKQDYINDVLKNLGAEAEMTSFGPESVGNVNKWISKVTRGVITDLVEEFDPDTRMLMANALYFKEDWVVDFSETGLENGRKLDKEPFNILGHENRKEEVKVPMMEQIATSDTYKYGRIEMVDSPPVQVVTIPYKNENFEMQIIIPGFSEAIGIAILEDQMKRGTDKLQQEDYKRKKPEDPFNLFSYNKRKYNKVIDDIGIKMPKFKISKKTDVSDILQEMGVNKIFEGAELGQMTDAGQLTVSCMLHKAVIDVDKKGRNAAPVTGIELVLLSATFGERIRLEVDHPFIFIIQDTRNHIPVMVGRVMDPRQTVEL